jgi:hypothetical protein
LFFRKKKGWTMNVRDHKDGFYYLCVEPNVYIAAPFVNGACGDYVCMSIFYPHGKDRPVLEKVRDISEAEWIRLENMPYMCWYPLWHGYTRERKPISWTVLQGKYTEIAPAGRPSRGGGKGKTGV